MTALCERLGWHFADPGLLERALTHRSWCAEHAGTLSNERLEFLGDSVLGMVITDQLIRRHPQRSEGWLSRARSDLVRAGTLYEIAGELCLGDHLRLGKGEERTGGREKPSILADGVEALIGAVYLDGGLEAASSVVLDRYASRLDAQDARGAGDDPPTPADFKSRLQELCARDGGPIPTYSSTDTGPEHDKTFSAEVHVDGRLLASGVGRSKKQAEQHAAERALAAFDAHRSETDAPRAGEPDRPHETAIPVERSNEVTSG